MIFKQKGSEMSNIETHVEELNREIADQKRQLEDKVKLIKFTDKANSEMALEIAKLKKQVKNMLISNASLNSQAVLQVGLHNDVVEALNLAINKPMQPLIDKRFKENKIVRHCLDAGGTDLNKICMIDFSIEDREQFAQLIGYSLGGYGDLSYVTDESYNRAEKQSEAE